MNMNGMNGMFIDCSVLRYWLSSSAKGSSPPWRVFPVRSDRIASRFSRSPQSFPWEKPA